MPLIPFDPCSGDAEPGDCMVLPDIGEAILALGLVGLEPFLPVGECGYDFHTYLSMGRPVAEFYDALSVHLTDFGPDQRTSISSCASGVWPTLIATWQVELWENCYPVVDDNGIPPTADELNRVNRFVYAHGLAVYNALLAGWLNKTGIFPPAVGQIRFGPLQPLAPQGAAVGWKFTVITELG